MLVIGNGESRADVDINKVKGTKIGNSAIGCTVNGQHSMLQTILKNGDLVNIETSKNASPSLHWLSSSSPNSLFTVS